jgi:hypothetical protein
MDETTKDVLLLVAGALILFVPQELSKHFQSKRDVAKEKRVIKQQRLEKLWQLELERFARLELLLSKILANVLTDAEIVIVEDATYIKNSLLRYPEMSREFGHFLHIAAQYKNRRRGQNLPEAEENHFAELLDTRIRNLLELFSKHLEKLQ